MINKGILKIKNIEILSYIIFVSFFIVYLSGLPNIGQRNFSLVILFFVINLIYAAVGIFVIRSIDKKTKDYFPILIGLGIIVIVLLFNIWIGFLRF